jgi:hypothetical protein
VLLSLRDLEKKLLAIQSHPDSLSTTRNRLQNIQDTPRDLSLISLDSRSISSYSKNSKQGKRCSIYYIILPWVCQAFTSEDIYWNRSLTHHSVICT